MKTGKLLGMLLFVLGTFSLMGCNDEMTDEEEGWYDSLYRIELCTSQARG